MEILRPAASVIPCVTLAAQSCKATYNSIAPLVGAPQSITLSKTILVQTERGITMLRDMLINKECETETSKVLHRAFQTVGLDNTLQSTHHVCDEFRATIDNITRHSTNSRFSERGKLATNIRETDIKKFNKQLGECQVKISSAVETISVAINAHAARNVENPGDHSTRINALKNPLRPQKDVLVNLDMKPKERQLSLRALDGRTGETLYEENGKESDRNIKLIQRLQEVYHHTLAATEAKEASQRFGNLMVENQSTAMQGIVGAPGSQVEQNFETLTAKDNSRAFQGQMSEKSFSMLFGTPI